MNSVLGNWSWFKQVVERHEHLIWEVESSEEDGATPKKANVSKILKNGSKAWWLSLHFFEGTRTAGVYKFENGEWKKYCSSCEEQELNQEGRGGPPNTSGFCSAQFKNESPYGVRCTTVSRRYDTLFNLQHPNYRSNTQVCKVCKKVQVTQTNPVQICGTNPKCERAYRKARYDLANGPIPVCTVCGKKTHRQNAVKICTTNPQCARAYEREYRKLYRARS